MASSLTLAALVLALSAVPALGSSYNWSYSGTDWPDTCATGMRQSPINIARSLTTDKGVLLNVSYNYAEWSSYNISNNGHVIQLQNEADTASSVTLPTGEYSLIQFHFHAPSEHARDGLFAVAECHFVHVKKDDPTALAVVGVELRLAADDKDNEWLASFIDDAPTSVTKKTVTKSLKPSDLFLSSTGMSDVSFYTYKGSLTTPGCAEVVEWHVLKFPKYISVKQSIALMDPVSLVSHGERTNNRPPQTLNGREIGYYRAFV